MSTYKNPLTPLIANPVNLDRPIQELQQAFASLPWLDRSYGRAYESVKRSGDKVLIYPEVWQGLGKDLLNVLPNDNLKSQSFFKVEEPITMLEYANGSGYSKMKASVSAIFWMNLKEIDASIDYRYLELLKGQAQRKITNAELTSGSVSILRSWETAAQVFKGYDISHVDQQELVHPCAGFRFDLEIIYDEDCPDTVYTVPQP